MTAAALAIVNTAIPELIKNYLPQRAEQNPGSGVSVIVYQSGPGTRNNPAVVVDTTGKYFDSTAPSPRRPGL